MKSEERCRRAWEMRKRRKGDPTTQSTSLPLSIPLCSSLDCSRMLESLADKKVIIVGPAGYLQGKQLGQWIDSFDVVVRINHAIPIAFPDDYGTRTDILYHILSHRNPVVSRKTIIDKSEVELWKDHNIKWLVSRHSEGSRRVREVTPIIGSEISWCCISGAFYNRIKATIRKKSPNTGVVAIMHLLSAQLSSLTIIGFDLYASGVYQGYGDVGPGEDASKINDRWHSKEAHVRYMRRIVRHDSRVIIDDHLKEILHV